MAKRAGVAKGLLFYYFGSKKGLFLYLTDYCIEFLHGQFFDGLESNREDVFERILRWTVRKWSMAETYPLQYAFLVKQLLDSPSDVERLVAEKKAKYKALSMQRFFDNLDLSNLRPDVDGERAVEFVSFVVEGLRARNTEKYKENPRPLQELHKEILPELKEYLDLCRRALCASGSEPLKRNHFGGRS
jgi:AcrR family transcriptional regulator